MSELTALIDGDVLVYQVGFGANDIPLRLAESRMAKALENILVATGGLTYEVYLSPRGRIFRHEVATRLEYKGNRKASPRPLWYDELREYLMVKQGATMAVNEEADDLLGIEACKRGESAIICTLDKDLDMIPGWHYNWRKRDITLISRPEAKVNFWRQVLTGDATDNIPGVPGIGPGMAKKLFPKALDTSDHWNMGLMAYGMAGLTEEQMIETARLVWIRREAGQVWNPPE